MELVVFDMDGTLLDGTSRVSPFTAETLELMRLAGIPYTVATGRTLQAAQGPLEGHPFELPLILKNGAIIWCPKRGDYSHSHLLTQAEVNHVINAFVDKALTPFVFTLSATGDHAVYHGTLKNTTEQKLAELFEDERALPLEPLANIPEDESVINVSTMGRAASVEAIIEGIANEPHLVAYTGTAIQDKDLRWLDIHHSQGSKANGISALKRDLNIDKVIVFGDGENDLSMFAMADEAYAPENADPEVKAAAHRVIGHHNEDGIAHFLRERFQL